MFKSFLKTASFTFFTKGFTILAGLISFSVTAKYLGPEGRGVLVYLGAVAGSSAMLVNFSMNKSLLNFFSQDEIAEKKKEYLPEAMGAIISFFGIAWAVGVLLVIGAYTFSLIRLPAPLLLLLIVLPRIAFFLEF